MTSNLIIHTWRWVSESIFIFANRFNKKWITGAGGKYHFIDGSVNAINIHFKQATFKIFFLIFEALGYWPTSPLTFEVCVLRIPFHGEIILWKVLNTVQSIQPLQNIGYVWSVHLRIFYTSIHHSIFFSLIL